MAKTQDQQELVISIPITGFIRQSMLLEMVPFSASTLWRKVKSGEFPRPVKLFTNITAWRVEEVIDWINSFPTHEQSNVKI